MKRKTIALMTAFALAVSLSACGSNSTNDKFQSDNNSNAERIAELEQELEELRAENKELKEQLGNSNTADNSQQPVNETDSLLKATVESPETSGVCGANLTWYYQNGVLAITGTGEMTDYGYGGKDTPWYELRDKIGWVIIDEGATTVGENAFYKCNILSKVIFPRTLTSIGGSAFEGCDSIKEFTFKGDVPSDLDVEWFGSFYGGGWDYAAGYEPTEEKRLRDIGEHFIPMTIYYTSDTFDELINGYPYWSDYGVNWVKQ